jgi:hypothetical protein
MAIAAYVTCNTALLAPERYSAYRRRFVFGLLKFKEDEL